MVYSRQNQQKRAAGEERARKQKELASTAAEDPGEAVIRLAENHSREAKGQKTFKDPSRPPAVSGRVWRLTGEFLRIGHTTLGVNYLRVNRETFALDLSAALNSPVPSPELRTIRRKFRGPEFHDTLFWILEWAVAKYWDELESGREGISLHHVWFLNDLDAWLYRGMTMFEIERLRKTGFKAKVYDIKWATPEQLAERQKVRSEARVRKWLADQGFEPASLDTPTNEEEPQQ